VPENVVPFVELPQSSGEYEGSGEVDPVAAASAADKIAEFVSASEEVLGAGTSRVPLEFLRSEQEEEAVWKPQFEVGSHIQDRLDRALELHGTTDFHISNVSALPLGIARVRFCFHTLYSRSSTCSG